MSAWVVKPHSRGSNTHFHSQIPFIIIILIKYWKNSFNLRSPFCSFPSGSNGKESTCSVGDLGSIPGWEDPLEKEMATRDGGNNGTFMRTVVKIDRLVMVTNLLSLPDSWITALSWWKGMCNSTKLRTMPCRATQDRW